MIQRVGEAVVALVDESALVAARYAPRQPRQVWSLRQEAPGEPEKDHGFWEEHVCGAWVRIGRVLPHVEDQFYINAFR